jgi:hypothetical protein
MSSEQIPANEAEMTTSAQSLLDALLEDDVIDKGYVCHPPLNEVHSYTYGNADLDPQHFNLCWEWPRR